MTLKSFLRDQKLVLMGVAAVYLGRGEILEVVVVAIVYMSVKIAEEIFVK